MWTSEKAWLARSRDWHSCSAHNLFWCTFVACFMSFAQDVFAGAVPNFQLSWRALRDSDWCGAGTATSHSPSLLSMQVTGYDLVVAWRRDWNWDAWVLRGNDDEPSSGPLPTWSNIQTMCTRFYFLRVWSIRHGRCPGRNKSQSFNSGNCFLAESQPKLG